MPPKPHTEKEDLKAWLDRELRQHRRLASKVQSILEKQLAERDIVYLTIGHRVKSLHGALEKIERKQYTSPRTQLTDLTGIRVVTYLESQVQSVAKAIQDIFEVDVENSSSRDRQLGVDRIGYRSLHFVCKLPTERLESPQDDRLEGLTFEIQIRTALQHAWAELAHDNTFKIDVALPDVLQRKLNLHSAMLELADRGFQEIFDEAEGYKGRLSGRNSEELLAIDIDSLSLYQYLSRLASSWSIKLTGDLDKAVINEVLGFGLRTIRDLEHLVTDDFKLAYLKFKPRTNTFRGFVRSLLLYSNLEKYLDLPRDWDGMIDTTYRMLTSHYGTARVDKILGKREIELVESS
ncbi:MAG TPA: hypothetical protein VG757_07360 [Devosia sp.]|nr:hypothetical protein [Devosia sp.]